MPVCLLTTSSVGGKEWVYTKGRDPPHTYIETHWRLEGSIECCKKKSTGQTRMSVYLPCCMLLSLLHHKPIKQNPTNTNIHKDKKKNVLNLIWRFPPTLTPHISSSSYFSMWPFPVFLCAHHIDFHSVLTFRPHCSPCDDPRHALSDTHGKSGALLPVGLFRRLPSLEWQRERERERA